jgi:microcystin-dependent protein
MYHSGNFDPALKANVSGTYSGLDVGNASTVGGQLGTSLSPPGMIGMFATSNAPTGWLKANGAAVSRTTYAALFNAIGTFYGTGNGSTTFNLPDLRGEFPRFWDDARGVDTGRGIGTAQGSQNLSHSHSGNTDNAGSHGHFLENSAIRPPGDGSGRSTSTGAQSAGTVGLTLPSGDHTHAILTNPSGGTEARPRNVALLACIKI